MGFLDTLRGRTKPVKPNLDALFGLPSAAVTLEAATGHVLSGSAGICWKPPPGRTETDLEGEMKDLLDGGSMDQSEDSYGYRWLVLGDPDADELVTRVHFVNSTLSDAGWGPQLLCSVFGLRGTDAKPMFLVYLYKRGTFYPFAPTGGEHRDTEAELSLRSALGDDLPIESDLSRWFPLWDLPVK